MPPREGISHCLGAVGNSDWVGVNVPQGKEEHVSGQLMPLGCAMANDGALRHPEPLESSGKVGGAGHCP